MVSNLKKFKKHSFEESVKFFEEFQTDLVKVESLKENSWYYEDLVYDLNQFSHKNPCSMMRLIYERSIIPEPSQLMVLRDIYV